MLDISFPSNQVFNYQRYGLIEFDFFIKLALRHDHLVRQKLTSSIRIQVVCCHVSNAVQQASVSLSDQLPTLAATESEVGQ